MAALFRFVDVCCEGSDRVHSFTLRSGETRLLQLSSRLEKETMIDLAIGETNCRTGAIEILHSHRTQLNTATIAPQTDSTAIWQPLSASRPGLVGWVAANGGLISNLRIWENVTLPLWYHTRRELAETEQSVIHWLGALGMEQEAFAEFMAELPYSIELWQRKLAGLLRALVQMPRILVVDAGVFEDVQVCLARNWIAALESYAAHDRAVLAITDKATDLSWEKIE